MCTDLWLINKYLSENIFSVDRDFSYIKLLDRGRELEYGPLGIQLTVGLLELDSVTFLVPLLEVPPFLCNFYHCNIES